MCDVKAVGRYKEEPGRTAALSCPQRSLPSEGPAVPSLREHTARGGVCQAATGLASAPGLRLLGSWAPAPGLRDLPPDSRLLSSWPDASPRVPQGTPLGAQGQLGGACCPLPVASHPFHGESTLNRHTGVGAPPAPRPPPPWSCGVALQLGPRCPPPLGDDAAATSAPGSELDYGFCSSFKNVF